MQEEKEVEDWTAQAAPRSLLLRLLAISNIVGQDREPEL